MKTKQLLLIFSAIWSLQYLDAQTVDNKVAIGIDATRSEYLGDFGNGLWNFNQKYPGIGAGLTLATYLNPSFDLGLQGAFGEYGYYKNAIHRFIGDKIDASVFLHYKLNNGYMLKKSAKLSPFLTAGIGAANYRRNSFDDDVNPRIIEGYDLIVPVGAGLKYQFSNCFAIQYQYLYNFTNHDKVDQINGKTNAIYNDREGNDAFGQHRFSLIFTLGKAKDTDKDGVPDKYDKCPSTPAGVQVDELGCPVDTDTDGVPDYLDKCPLTPANVKVDANGCPLDSDGDGVPDYLDKGPNTPKGVKVDADGRPIDTDADGVADYLDKCPNTQKGIKVDTKGCPLDSDGDGVPDYLDKCADTPKGATVDAFGCPVDTDKDGVPDYLDKCPTVPGIAANKGCPEIKAETKKVFAQALQGIQFESGKDVIKKMSFPILNKVVAVMKDNPSYNLEINGHTDNTGDAATNLMLSQKRADAVKNYLVMKGINGTRLTAKGYGQTMPVADNATVKGRAQNRRVEFKVLF